MDDLRTAKDLVLYVLQTNEQARNSDNVLYYHVLKKLGDRKGIDIEKMSIPHFFLHVKEYGFPNFETVRRTRQKFQQAYPELRGSDDIEAMRALNEQRYRDFARRPI